MAGKVHKNNNSNCENKAAARTSSKNNIVSLKFDLHAQQNTSDCAVQCDFNAEFER